MATRTEPMRIAPCLVMRSEDRSPVLDDGGRSAAFCVIPASAAGLRTRLPLRRDQLVQPADFSFHRLQAMPLQFERVAVHALAGAGRGGAEAVQPLLEPAAPTFEDPH